MQVIAKKYGRVTIYIYIYLYLTISNLPEGGKKIRFNEDSFIFTKVTNGHISLTELWNVPVRHNENNQIKVAWLHVTFSFSKFN